MARIAIIDDAIQDERLLTPAAVHYRLENGLFRQTGLPASTNVRDTHGTLVVKVLQTYTNHCEIISIQILEDWFTQRSCSAERLIAALEFCSKLDIDAIHCSIGTERLSRIRQIRDLLEMFTHRKILVIAAGSNAMYRTIPASCPGILGVRCAEEDFLPPGTFAFAKDPYSGTGWIANYELPATSNTQYAKSSSLAAPVVTAQVNDLLDCGTDRSFPAMIAALQCCAWPGNAADLWKARIFRTPEPVPIAYLIDIFTRDGQAQSKLLDIFALHGYEAVGITGINTIQDVRLLCYADLPSQSPAEIQIRLLASVRTDLLIVFLASDDARYWQQGMDPDTAVLHNTQFEYSIATDPQQVYDKLSELFLIGYEPEENPTERGNYL